MVVEGRFGGQYSGVCWRKVWFYFGWWWIHQWVRALFHKLNSFYSIFDFIVMIIIVIVIVIIIITLIIIATILNNLSLN